MMYKIIINGHTDTADRTFEQAAQALADACRKKDIIRIRARTYGRGERELNQMEQSALVVRAAKITEEQ